MKTVAVVSGAALLKRSRVGVVGRIRVELGVVTIGIICAARNDATFVSPNASPGRSRRIKAAIGDRLTG